MAPLASGWGLAGTPPPRFRARPRAGGATSSRGIPKRRRPTHPRCEHAQSWLRCPPRRPRTMSWCNVEVGMDCAQDQLRSRGDHMVAHVRRAERNSTGRTTDRDGPDRGPSLRSNANGSGTAVVEVRPTRDAFGQVTRSRCGLSPGGGGRDAPPRWTIGSSPKRLLSPTVGSPNKSRSTSAGPNSGRCGLQSAARPRR